MPAICSTVLSKSGNQSQIVPKFTLSWSHYLQLMGVENPEARRFYEIEAAKEHWDVRWLGRQIHFSLYERLALSREKNSVMQLATNGQTPSAQLETLTKSSARLASWAFSS